MSQSSSRTGKRSHDSGLPSSDCTNKTSTTGAYDPQFEQMLIDTGVYPDGYEGSDGEVYEPANIDTLRQLLPVSRNSLSPSKFPNEAFKEFQRINRRAKSEAKAMATVIPIIAGARDNQCSTEDNTLCNNLEKFEPNLRMLQPDKYYGTHPERIDLRVRADLGKYIVPSTDTTRPAAPNYFLEGKSAAGRPDVAQRQIMHDNAYGARAMFQLQNYGRETPTYDGNAYTIGSTYHPGTGTLQMYATHPRQAASGGTEYHMTQLDGYQMTGNIDTFRKGAAAYRNSREFAQEQRDRLIAAANATARSLPTVTTPSTATGSQTNFSSATASGSFDSDTSTDELAPEYEEVPKRQRRRNTLTASAANGTGRVRRMLSQQTPTVGSSSASQQQPAKSRVDISNRGTSLRLFRKNVTK